jgi:TPR repeat protein
VLGGACAAPWYACCLVSGALRTICTLFVVVGVTTGCLVSRNGHLDTWPQTPLTEAQRRGEELWRRCTAGEVEVCTTLCDGDGPPAACLFLGQWYQRGEAGLTRDLEQSRYFYAVGCKRGLPAACRSESALAR